MAAVAAAISNLRVIIGPFVNPGVVGEEPTGTLGKPVTACQVPVACRSFLGSQRETVRSRQAMIRPATITIGAPMKVVAGGSSENSSQPSSVAQTIAE